LVVAAALCASNLSAHPPTDHSDLNNSIGMKFVWVNKEPGKEVRSNEAGFYIGAHEVTQADFKRVMKSNPSEFSKSGRLAVRVQGIDADRLPVDSVSWDAAIEFCRAISEFPEEKNSGRVYRLPTSAEWELASRAGNDGWWCFGNDRKQLEEYAWFGFDLCGQRTHAVGKKKQNGFGLYDTYGNVWEWCCDVDPRETGATQPKATGRRSRIIRGGGWMSEPSRCNSVYWQADPPKVTEADTGFRVVIELPDKLPSR